MSLCHTFSFVKPISLQLYDVNLWYFKLTLFNITEFIAWNIKSLRHWVALILKLENQSLWQKLNSFVRKTKTRGATSSQLLHQFYLFPLSNSQHGLLKMRYMLRSPSPFAAIFSTLKLDFHKLHMKPLPDFFLSPWKTPIFGLPGTCT